jgi:hypothetical protein
MHLAASLRQKVTHPQAGGTEGRGMPNVLQSLKYAAAAVYKGIEFPRKGIVCAPPVSEEARA